MKDQEYKELSDLNAQLTERIALLEERVFGARQNVSITLHQQILMLDYLGVLKPILDLKISNVKKADLIGVLLNRDPSNVKKAIENLQNKEGKELKSKRNLHFLVEVFNHVSLDEQFAAVMDDLSLTMIPSEKELRQMDKAANKR